jgi:hypothetical protein
MATDRRVIMRTSVLPTQTGTLEEYTAKTSRMVSTQGGRLGGTSKLTDITATQWSDSWTSMMSEFAYWETLTDSTDISGNRWEDVEEPWDGILSLSTSGVPLADDTSDLQFCYIKNLGSNTVKISLDANSTYPLKLSSGASTMFRGYSTNLKINEVYVKTASGTSTIEYLIAK